MSKKNIRLYFFKSKSTFSISKLMLTKINYNELYEKNLNLDKRCLSYERIYEELNIDYRKKTLEKIKDNN